MQLVVLVVVVVGSLTRPDKAFALAVAVALPITSGMKLLRSRDNVVLRDREREREVAKINVCRDKQILCIIYTVYCMSVHVCACLETFAAN